MVDRARNAAGSAVMKDLLLIAAAFLLRRGL
jgi:hypothetical protein